jgi:hypothetical protein
VRRVLIAALAPALIAPVLVVQASTASAAISRVWTSTGDGMDTAARMNMPIEGSTGRSGWAKHSSPVVGNLDDDPKTLEIAQGSLDGKVYVFKANGSRQAGWPKRLDAPATPAGPVNGGVALGDLTGDGRLDVVAGSDNGWVFAWDRNGNLLPGWPQFTGWNADYPQHCGYRACTGVVAAPTIADLDGDGRGEVIVGSYSHLIWVWDGSGRALPGWPRDVWDGVASSAAVGDLDGDGVPEIVIGSDVENDCANCPPYGQLRKGGLVHAFRTDGTQLPGWPTYTDSFMWSSPALADVDGDGRLEVIAGGGYFISEQGLRGRSIRVWKASGGAPRWGFGTRGVVVGGVAVGDVNGDGRAEIAYGDAGCEGPGTCPGGELVLLTLAGDRLTPMFRRDLGGGSYFGGPVLGDITGDGRPEVVAADANWHVQAVDVNGNTRMNVAHSQFTYWNSPAVADLDGNGINEVVASTAVGEHPSAPTLPEKGGRLAVTAWTTDGRGGLLFPQMQSRVVLPRCDSTAPGKVGVVSPGVVRGSVLYLRNSYSSGVANSVTCLRMTGTVVTGDWDGNGTRTPAVFRDGRWTVFSSNGPDAQTTTVWYGSPGDIPVAGDWNNDRIDTLGVFRGGVWHLRNSVTSGAADGSFRYGSPGDVPVVGDWNNDGTDTLGVFRGGYWYLTNYFDRGFAEGVFRYGSPGDVPVPGDWNRDGTDTLGVFRGGTWYLTNYFDRGVAEGVFAFGSPGDRPVLWR